MLNRNPENYFAEVEQATFNPAHFVPGIGPSPDKMLQGRLFSYGDTHRYRLGANHMRPPVNQPHATRANNYGRDGAMRTDIIERSIANFRKADTNYGGPGRQGGRATPHSKMSPCPSENDLLVSGSCGELALF